MRLTLRLSLAARALVAAAVVAPLTAVLCLLLAFFGALFGLALTGVTTKTLATAATAPRLAAATPLSEPAALVLALGVLLAVFSGWSSLSPYTRDDHLIPPSGPTQWGLVSLVLVALYELVVEPLAWLAGVVDGGPLLALVPAGLGAVVGLVASVRWLRSEARALRALSVEGTETADPTTHGRLLATVDRLARIAGVPAPEVRVLDSSHPLAHTVGTRRDAVLVVSTGLLDALTPSELEAVLAHEAAHLANADSRLMSLALAPVVLAEELWGKTTTMADGPGSDPRDWPWYALGVCLRTAGQFGASVFAVGREAAADETAARLTGDPAALASALQTLAGRDPPETDLRAWSESVAALGVLPSLAPEDGRDWRFSTHPQTEDRIARLRELAAADERR